MIRVKMDALETKDGLYLLKGEIFQGIGYHVSAHQVVAAYSIEQGQLGAKLGSTISPGMEASGIVSDFLEPNEENYDGEPVSYNSKPFTGLAYEFRKQHCVSEELYLDGCSKRAVTWYLSGNIATYEILDERVIQDIAWFENGLLKFVKYTEKDVFEFDLRFNESNFLTCVRIFGDYFGRLYSLKENLKLNNFDMNFIKHQICADISLYMAGDGIDDDILCSIVESGGLSITQKLHISNTLIGRKGIDSLSHLERLKHLIFECDECQDMKDALVRLKDGNRSLVIEFNGANVGPH